MSGGNRTKSRRRYARSAAAGLLGGLLMTSSGVAEASRGEEMAEAAFAAMASDDCEPRPGERSIIIENGRITSADPEVSLATDQSSEAPLEPIANVSEYEPDLADAPMGRGTLVPTLADPPARPAPTTAGDYADDGVMATDAPVATASPEAASFNGATPGQTTRGELLKLWGSPRETNIAGATLTFQPEGFASVTVGLANDRVQSIRVVLTSPTSAARLADKLGLADFRPAVVREDGVLVSTTYPERGVTFHHEGALDGAMATDASTATTATTPTDAVSEIVLRPIEGAAFVQRAKSHGKGEPNRVAADLEMALQLDPRSAAACSLLSALKLAASDAIAAEQLAAQSVKLDGANDAYRLHWAKCLKQLARYDEAVQQTRQVLEGTTATQLVRAQALEQMGRLASLGSKDVQERSIPLHNKAIELADQLAVDNDETVRAAANEVLLSAHLAIAEQIAAGQWQQKDEFVGQWISRASALAEQMIASGEADVSLRLRVAVSALAAGGRLSPPVDPKLWVAEAEQAAADLEPAIVDRLIRERIDWQLGLAYYYAAEIQHRRGQSALAIEYGEHADALMTPLAARRVDLPDTAYVLGRLYFQIGAVHAVHGQDHAAACRWYDRAADLLLKPTPLTTLAHPSQHGDSLVSMGVSYWETGQRQLAYDLTEAGAELVKQGVAEGLLGSESLTVPEGNLAAMTRAMGKGAPAMMEGPNSRGTQVAQGGRRGPHTAAERSNRGNAPSRVAERRTTSEGGLRRR